MSFSSNPCHQFPINTSLRAVTRFYSLLMGKVGENMEIPVSFKDVSDGEKKKCCVNCSAESWKTLAGGERNTWLHKCSVYHNVFRWVVMHENSRLTWTQHKEQDWRAELRGRAASRVTDRDILITAGWRRSGDSTGLPAGGWRAAEGGDSGRSAQRDDKSEIIFQKDNKILSGSDRHSFIHFL